MFTLIHLPTPRRLLLLTLLAVVLATTAILVAGSYLAKPANHPMGSPPPDLHAQTVQIPSASGSLLAGWLLQGEGEMGGVLLLHGVHADRWSVLDRARFLRRAGYTVLLIDLQAHGASPGAHITFGYLEAKDVEAAGTYLRRELPGRPLAVIGPSLGGAAVLLAARPLPFDAVVLESVYPTIEAATRARLEVRLGRVGGWFAPLLLLQLKPRLGISPEALRPIDRIGTLGKPLLLLSGATDPHPTAAEAESMFARAAPPKALYLFPGVGHEDLFLADSTVYGEQVLPFLARYLHHAS